MIKCFFCLFIFFLFNSECAFSQFQEQQIQKVLVAHNAYRKELGVQNLEWSNELAQSADEWAKYLAENELFEHSETNEENPIGENIWRGTPKAFSLTEMVQMWGDEKKSYRYQKIPKVDPPFAKQTGHYTQMVWDTTKKVGCALRSDGKNYDVLVCHYHPMGNIVGYYPYTR